MDKTILTLATVLISGAGIIGSLISYDPPKLHGTYLDFNPFGYKKFEIDKILKRVFVCLALFGLAIQAYPFFVTTLADQKYSGICYLLFFVGGSVVMTGLVFGIRTLCLAQARRTWLPELRRRLKEMYESSLFIIENDGWRSDQLQLKDQIDNPDTYRNANFRTADERIASLQKLFDVRDVQGDRRVKIESLKKIFETNA